MTKKQAISIFTRSLLRASIPKDWNLVAVGSLLSGTEYGLSEPGDSEGDTPIVGMRNLGDGKVILSDLSTINSAGVDLSHMRLRKGDILLNRTNSPDLVGKVGILCEGSEAVFASYLVRLTVKPGVVIPEYLNAWLNGDIAQRAIKRISTRAVSQANVNPTEFKKYCPVLLPLEVNEQARIAAVLQAWNDGIDKASQLCTTKRAQYREIRRYITSDSSQGRSGKELLRLSEITKRVRRVNDGQDHPVMTISAKSGFILQSDKYSRDMAGKSLENYIILHRGEFAYNKGNSLTSPQGCIFRLGEEKALVPHVYFCFSLKKGLHEDFFVHLFESGYLNHQLSRVINSGVRNDGLLNLNAAHFFNCRVPVPPVEEQARIAEILNGLRSELAILDRHVELLERQKRGLMQKLLTGEWRVKC